MNLGSKIKKLRELRNFTQEYMANQLNISQTGYCKIEKNERKLSLERIEQIAKILQVNLNDIISFDDKEIFNHLQTHSHIQDAGIKNLTSEEKKLYDNFISQLKEEIKHLKEMIDYLKSKN